MINILDLFGYFFCMWVTWKILEKLFHELIAETLTIVAWIIITIFWIKYFYFGPYDIKILQIYG